MRIVLDTSALWHAPLVAALLQAGEVGATRDGRLEVILPAVAYAERSRQLASTGRDPVRWKQIMSGAGVRIECFCEEQVERADARTLDDARWRTHGRDAFIAAHVAPGRTAVTADTGPVWADVPRMTPDVAAETILALIAPLD